MHLQLTKGRQKQESYLPKENAHRLESLYGAWYFVHTSLPADVRCHDLLGWYKASASATLSVLGRH